MRQWNNKLKYYPDLSTLKGLLLIFWCGFVPFFYRAKFWQKPTKPSPAWPDCGHQDQQGLPGEVSSALFFLLGPFPMQILPMSIFNGRRSDVCPVRGLVPNWLFRLLLEGPQSQGTGGRISWALMGRGLDWTSRWKSKILHKKSDNGPSRILLLSDTNMISNA